MAEKEPVRTLITINTDNLFKVFVWLWLGTIGIFGSLLLWASQRGGWNDLTGVFLLGDIIVGVAAFAIAIFLLLRNKGLLAPVFYGLIMLAVPIGLVLSLFSNQQPRYTPKSQSTSVLGTTSSPTPTKAVANKVQNKVTTSEPMVDCVGPDYVHFQATQKKCDEFQAAWNFKPKVFPSMTPYVSRAPTPQVIYVSQPTSTYTPPTYFRCTIYYSNLNRYETYDSLYKTKEECDAYQAAMDRSTYIPPTSNPTIYVPVYTVEQCKADVIYRYDQLFRNCNIQFGASSAAQACVEILSNERRNALLACE